MTARINPTKAKYYPEELPESIVTTSSSSGTNIASYSSFSPYTLFLQGVMTGQTPGVTLRVDNDSGHAVVESPLDVRPDRRFVDNDIVSYDSLDLWAVGSAVASYYTFLLKVTRMSVFEKIKYGLSLDDAEKSLVTEFDIQKKYQVGMLRRSVEAQQFKKIIEITRKVTVTAGSNTRVGRIVNVKKGQKAVLIGIAVDSGKVKTVNGGPGRDDTYFTLNRDSIDTAHIKLDCLSMPPLDNEVPCYIPAIDRHEIIIESLTGITDLPVRYRYSIADISLIEKIRWGIALTSEERTVAEQFDLEDSVKAGVL